MSTPWIDILLFSLVFIMLVIIGVLQYFTGSCVHKWGDWRDESTDEAYVQFRQCIKCKYTEREQWKKVTRD